MIEALVAMSIFGLVFAALYSGLGSSYLAVQMARENLRATQIMAEKLDTIRLYGWEQVTKPGYIPTNFQAQFFPTEKSRNSSASSGLVYYGTVKISPAPVSEPYGADLREVTVHLAWQTGRLSRSARMATFVSRYGLQKYVY